MTPIVAIVGRPNVGKSTLFNRLLGKQTAIVADLAGVTRDRHYADAIILKRSVTLIDTGGFDPEDEDRLRKGIAKGVLLAIEEADLVVCVLDALNPPTDADRQAVALLRKSNAQVVYFANRADNEKLGYLATDHYALGIDDLIVGSALHGRNLPALQRAIVAGLPEAAEVEDETEEVVEEENDEEAPKWRRKGPIRLALLGRPNAGKSSLLNRLCGQERSLVDDRPGTTRDPIDALVTRGDKEYRVVDTAGVRRKSKVFETVEAASVMRSLRALGEAEIIVLLCDAEEGLKEQDLKLLSLAVDRGKPVIVAMNKMDLLPTREGEKKKKEAQDSLHFAPWVPVLGISVVAETGLTKLMNTVAKAYDEFTSRVPTAALNRFVQEVLERSPPPSQSGKVPKIYYMTQVRTAPPLFVAMCSSPKLLQAAYQRFVANQMREAFGLSSIPIRVRFRGRRRREDLNR